ncbi:hypothetical protein HA402_008985 [Bradysia odoriphaga]|nr:hypothetical protein HA402_008985 [Bradysia odoriphaga]
MLAYKTLESHKLFENGWVRSISLKTIPNEKCIVLGLVEHTQKLNLPPLPWALCENAGKIITAHCTCIVCTHVGALLFGVESLVRTHANTSKTEVLCTWNGPTSKIGIVRVKKVSDMTFPSKKENHNAILPKRVPTATQNELFDFLKKLKEKSQKAPVACYIAENINIEFSTRKRKAQINNFELQVI